jgi:hypothetical protein
VATKGEINTEAFLRVLGPFFRAAQGTLDPAFQERVCKKVFSKFISDFARENMVHDGSTSDSDENRRFEDVESEAVQGLIFSIASDDDTIEKNRRKLYLLHQEFPALTGKQFVDNDAMDEEVDEEVEVIVTKKEKEKKQKNTEVTDMKIVEEEKGVKSVNAVEGSEKKANKSDKVESKKEEKKVEKKEEKKIEKKEEKKIENKEEKKEEKKEGKKEKRGRVEFEENEHTNGDDSMKKKEKRSNGNAELNAAADYLKEKKKELADKIAAKNAAAPTPPVAPAAVTTTVTSAATAVAVAAVSKSTPTSPSEPLVPFISSKKFTGSKTNYVFKNVSTDML